MKEELTRDSNNTYINIFINKIQILLILRKILNRFSILLIFQVNFRH